MMVLRYFRLLPFTQRAYASFFRVSFGLIFLYSWLLWRDNTLINDPNTNLI